MARHKHITHLPAAPAASPRLFAQLLTSLGELIVAGVFLLGLVTAGAWLLAGYDTYARKAARLDRTPAGRWVHCWRDRYGAEVCGPEERGSPVRRHYARDFY